MKRNWQGIVIVLLTTFAIIYVKFHELIGYLNNYMFNVQGDSFQSYYNFSYYLRYGSGIRFEGINYPYGEHLHFINSHPLYLYIIDLLGLQDMLALEGVGLINGMILLSILISAPFIYLILRAFDLPQWFAIIVAVIIQFNYPQFDRVNGHFEFALAYVIPIYWYLLILFRRSNRKLFWSTIIVVYTIFILLISAYMAVFCAAFCLALALVEVIQNRNNLVDMRRKAMPLFAIGLIPLIFFLVFVQFTDIVTDRPTNPWGFYEFNANPLSIFLPDTSVIRSLFPARMYDYAWEGRAYVGLPATFLAISMILYFIYQFFKERKIDFGPFMTNRELNPYLAAGIIVLLYSMCWPFEWGLQFIADNLPLLKQFRALGRFAWVFYYVFSVYTAYYLYHFYKTLKEKHNLNFVAFLLLVFALFHWAFDAGINLRKSNSKKIKPNTELYRSDAAFQKIFDQSNYKIDDFQAILSLPFTQTNGDKMLFHRAPHTIYKAMALAYHTGLPLIQNITPRQSFAHSLSSIQLLANPCIYKSRLDDMDDRHILLMVANTKLRPVEQAFINNKEAFYKDNQFTAYVLPVSVLNEEFESCRTDYLQYVLPDSSGNKRQLENQYVAYEGFEDSNEKAQVSFTGRKAFFRKKGEHIIWTSPEVKLEDGFYDISYWVHVDSRTAGMPNTFIDILDQDEKVLKSHFVNLREIHDVYGMWVRGSVQVKLRKGLRCQLRIDGKYMTVDDILMKSVQDNFLMSSENFDLFNNYPFYREN